MKFEHDIYETLRGCPYCKSKRIALFLEAPDRLTGHPGTFYLSRCHSCDLVFQNPRVREELISEFYTRDLGYYQPPQPKPETRGIFRRIKNFLGDQTLINHLGYNQLGRGYLFFKVMTSPLVRHKRISLMPYFINGGRLLEIGCSHGARLEVLGKLGWSVVGVEMDENSARYAAKRRKLSVINSKIESVSFPDNTFDAVIMSMVLEHLYNPFKILKKLTKWLKPGGELIFSIPYFGGLEFRLFREYSYGLQLPHHITFFNNQVIKEFLSKLGYREIKFYFHFFDRDVVASAVFKHQDSGKLIYELVGRSRILRMLVIRPMVYLLSIIGITSRVTIVARRV